MKVETKHAFVFPNPVALVTVSDPPDKSNIITLAWVGMACSDPVTVTIAVRPSTYSHGLLVESREFALNIPGTDLVRETDRCGVVSGRDVDKWKLTGLTPEPAIHVKAPLIRECNYALECSIVEILELGAHDLFVGRVVAAHVDDSVVDDNGHVDYAKLDPLAYLPYDYFAVGKQVYRYGQSAKD